MFGNHPFNRDHFIALALQCGCGRSDVKVPPRSTATLTFVTQRRKLHVYFYQGDRLEVRTSGLGRRTPIYFYDQDRDNVRIIVRTISAIVTEFYQVIAEEKKLLTHHDYLAEVQGRQSGNA